MTGAVTYDAILQRLIGARRFGVVLGLDRMRTLLDALGSPDRHLGRVIHVAGTNGKGSTVAMLGAMLRAGGLRVATYTSPHLNALVERVQIDGEAIPRAAFVDQAQRVSAAGGDELTFFEQVTAIAMSAIAAARVDVTVLEVGLGGRLDATNIVAADIAVITGVAMDHEAILGATLAAIAGEKAGIIKRGQRVVIGAAGEPEAVAVLAHVARTHGIEPVVVDAAAIAAVPPVALVGDHQRANAACALAALDALQAIAPGLTIGADARIEGLATVTHPGRFEIIDNAWVSAGGPDVSLDTVILDGAHNPHGAAALARELQTRHLRPVLVVAVSGDKNVRGLVRALLPAVDHVVCVRYQQDRAMDPAVLATIVREESDALGVPAVIVGRDDAKRDAGARVVFVETSEREHLKHALVTAADLARDGHARTIVVAGSLFVVAEARALLLGIASDPVDATDPAVRR